MESKKEPQKLKILTFHGYGNNKESFEYMQRHFKEQFGSVCEFHIIEGPFVILDDPDPILLKKGFKEPFYAYMKFVNSYPPDENSQTDYNVFDGAEITVDKSIKYMREHGPFDGIFGFS